MLIVAKLDGTRRYLPYYRNMRVGQFVTQVAAPALGCVVREDGDVYDRFVLDGALVFTAANKDKYLGEVVADCSTLFFTMCFGRLDAELVGNGSRVRPTEYQLTLEPGVEELQNLGGPSTVAKRRRGPASA
jgi:hypothetical protein